MYWFLCFYYFYVILWFLGDEEESAEDFCEVCPEGVEIGDVEEGDQVGRNHLGPGLLLGGSLGLTNDKVFAVHCLNFGWFMNRFTDCDTNFVRLWRFTDSKGNLVRIMQAQAAAEAQFQNLREVKLASFHYEIKIGTEIKIVGMPCCNAVLIIKGGG